MGVFAVTLATPEATPRTGGTPVQREGFGANGVLDGTARLSGRSNPVKRTTRENEEIMNTRYVAIAAVAVAGAIGLAACGGGADQPASAPSAPAPAEPILDAGQAGGTVLAGQALDGGQLVGMPLDVAISWVEEQGRQWRVGREDGVDLALTADFVLDRVTFTVEDGVVTAATIENEDDRTA